MDNFTFYSPTYFVFGKGTEAQTGELVKRYGGHKVLIHYGGGSVKRSGLLDRVKASPLSDLVYEGIELAKKEKVDFILPLGGGSVMDSAKGIALGALYDGDFWDYYCGKKGPEKFVKFATRIFGCQNDFEHPEVTAMEGVKLLRAFFDELGMPNSISSLGGKPEDIPGMVENMFYGAPNHGNFIKLPPEIAAEIYSMAM